MPKIDLFYRHSGDRDVTHSALPTTDTSVCILNIFLKGDNDHALIISVRDDHIAIEADSGQELTMRIDTSPDNPGVLIVSTDTI